MKPFTPWEWVVGQKMVFGPGRSYHRNSPYIWWLRLRGLKLPPGYR